MDEELISKKELLELTGISYGQLYRWKRKNLIPEEWFIRKSTFTGQETFFLRQKILARVERIKNMKDDLSLDDLAEVFSPNLSDVILSQEAVARQTILSQPTLDILAQTGEQAEKLSFDQILQMYVLDKLLVMGEISLDEGKQLLDVLHANYANFQGKICELIIVRKLGVTVFFITSPSEIYFDQGSKVVAKLNLAGCIEELKTKLMNGGLLNG